MEAAAAKLLDFSQPLDVPLLDQVVTTAYDASNPKRNDANLLLMRMKESPDLWTRSDAILEQSQSPNTRFFGLQILDGAIQTRWKILPIAQREGIKNYVVSKIIQLSQTEESLRQEKLFINKINQVLVQILKQEWPHNWPTFISDVCDASRTNEVLCENNMQILKLLSEEVFDFSRDQMTTAKIKTMKESLNEEFAKIYELCEYILNLSQRPSLLNGTLKTLQRFLTWIPLGYIFERQLIDALVNKFFPESLFRTSALECLTEIACLSDLDARYDPLFQQMFVLLVKQLSLVIKADADLAGPFEKATEVEQVFLKKLALFFTGFMKSHLAVLENRDTQEVLMAGMEYLVHISEVPDDEIFKICLEFYHYFSQDLYQDLVQTFPATTSLGLAQGAPPASFRRAVYKESLTKIRHVLITRMAKPEEVLIVEDENGEIVRETTRDTEAIAQYKTMRETLVYLTHLNNEDTETIMLEKLSKQVEGSQFSWNNLNTLCWAIGSISGAMNEEEEKRFLVTVIKDLLNLCEMKRGKDNKAVVASNIMYVVGQYPRFLRAHWKFLRTVVNKLFEFMHELHPGVQDMACDTFLKIAHKCKSKFMTVQVGEQVPFVEELLRQLHGIVSDLETHQVHTFYEAVACMLSDRGENPPIGHMALDRRLLLGKLMEMPNIGWKSIFDRAELQPNFIKEPDTVKEVSKILRTNTRVCSALGPMYIHQLGMFYLNMLKIYQHYSEHISQAVAEQGELATRLAPIRAMRGAKKEVLKLITTFIEKAGPPEAPEAQVAQSFVPPMLDPILGDYQRNIAGARDPEVLALFSTAIEKLGAYISQSVPKIMEAVFECTLQMITLNFEDYPETRLRFFTFLKAVNTHCFGALFEIPPEHQKLVVDSVVWAMKHTERNIAETGLDIMYELLQNVGNTPEVAQGFYQQFLLSLIQDILAMMTDRLHKSGFKMHATLLRHIFHLVEGNHITLELYDPQQHPGVTSNQQYVADFVGNLLLSSFANLTKTQVANFVAGLFSSDMDLNSFKIHLRDFLVTLKEFSSEDNADLYYEESMAKKRAEEQSARQALLAVPGLVNPHDRPEDDMADL
ncbi:unnamed protein product [Discosporangium mesarthrocarpum]